MDTVKKEWPCWKAVPCLLLILLFRHPIITALARQAGQLSLKQSVSNSPTYRFRDARFSFCSRAMLRWIVTVITSFVLHWEVISFWGNFRFQMFLRGTGSDQSHFPGWNPIKTDKSRWIFTLLFVWILDEAKTVGLRNKSSEFQNRILISKWGATLWIPRLVIMAVLSLLPKIQSKYTTVNGI